MERKYLPAWVWGALAIDVSIVGENRDHMIRCNVRWDSEQIEMRMRNVSAHSTAGPFWSVSNDWS